MTHRSYVDVAGIASPIRTESDDYPLDSVQPHPHQQQLYEAITSEEPGYYINGASTGAGKTLSWVAPVLADGRNAISLYPTNALIEDQQRAIERLAEEDDALDPERLELVVLTSDRIDSLQDRHDTQSRGRAVEQEIRRAREEQRRTDGAVIVLTNPDILVLMRRRFFASRLEEHINFGLFVIDEFHRASRKERNTLRYTLEGLLDDEATKATQVVYLSATTEDELVEILREKSPHPVKTVESETVPFLREVPPDHRAIMPPVRLQLTPHETFKLGRYMTENGRLRQAVAEFVTDERTALILDGVREVESIHRRLQSFPKSNWTDGETVPQSPPATSEPDSDTRQDGSRLSVSSSDLTILRLDGFRRPDDINTAMQQFDVLVSNSAVEVGIDFDLDRLLFSADDNDSFIQRLGRLRTATDWHTAWGLVPSEAYRLDHGTGVVGALREAAQPHDEFCEQNNLLPADKTRTEGMGAAEDKLNASVCHEETSSATVRRPPTTVDDSDTVAGLSTTGPDIQIFSPSVVSGTHGHDNLESTDAAESPRTSHTNGTGVVSDDDTTPQPFADDTTVEYLGVVSRQALERAVQTGYPDHVPAPVSFDWEFSAVEAMRTVRRRAKDAPEDMRNRLWENGVKRIKQQFYDPHGDAPPFDADQQRRLSTRSEQLLAGDLLPYRGESLSVAVYHTERDRIFNYRISYILRYGDIEFVTESTFRDRAATSSENRQTITRALRYADGYCLFHGTIPTTVDPRQFKFTPGGDGTLISALRQASDIRRPVHASVNVSVDTNNETPAPQGLSRLNDCLTETEFLCYVTSPTPPALSEIYPIPTFMFLYQFTAQGQSGSIAFGHNALYLYAHLQQQ